MVVEGREVQEGGGIHIDVIYLLPCTEETNATLQSNYTPIKKSGKKPR